MENVHLVEITAYSDGDAYTIFETMNDRGLSLTPADMLKGYLLAHITDADDRVHAGKVWKDRISGLAELGKDEDADGIKAWLRSQYADTIRERKRGALPQDFDLIGTEFHRWVRDHEDRLGLNKSGDFVRFIDQDFAFYSHWYERLRMAADRLTPGLECIYFNAEHNFTLQYPVILSPLQLGDAEETIYRKVRVTAAYLDILIHRRIWNWRAIDYSTMQYAMFLVMREIRGMPSTDLADLLRQRLDAETRDLSEQRDLPPARDERASDPPAPRPDDGLRGDTVWDAVALCRVRQARRQRRLRDRAHLGGSSGTTRGRVRPP